MKSASIFDAVDCPIATLEGRALDYAVAIAEGGHSLKNDGGRWFITLRGCTYVLSNGWGGVSYQPSDNWVISGPIIEQEQITLAINGGDGKWLAIGISGCTGSGPTPLVAAMRCYVASKLGDSINVPHGIMEV